LTAFETFLKKKKQTKIKTPPHKTKPQRDRFKSKIMKVKVISYKAVAIWNWLGIPETTCSICQLRFESCCQGCIIPGASCPPIKAPKCAHWFHKHCAEKWLIEKLTDDQKVCPNCRSSWLKIQDGLTISQVQELELVKMNGDGGGDEQHNKNDVIDGLVDGDGNGDDDGSQSQSSDDGIYDE
jgi:Zn finger protein HypA/HybF involved in hydrogenase expression